MAEWSKARDSKSRNPQKGFEGSNPSLSAIPREPTLIDAIASIPRNCILFLPSKIEYFGFQ